MSVSSSSFQPRAPSETEGGSSSDHLSAVRQASEPREVGGGGGIHETTPAGQHVSPAASFPADHQQLDASVLLGMSPGAFRTDIFPLGDMLPAGASELWKTKPLSSSCSQRVRGSLPLPEPVWEMEMPQPAAGYSALESSSGGSRPAQRQQDLDRGLEKIMDGVLNLGFDNLEAMVVAYYMLDFDKGSAIHRAQRLSRKRHVRSLVSVLCRGAAQWAEDEACPLREEILKAAEDLYAADVQSLHAFPGLGSAARGPAQIWEDWVWAGSEEGSEIVEYRELRCEVSTF